jgi:hypothetical protein
VLEGASELVEETRHARYKAEQRDECDTGSEGGNVVKGGFGTLIGWFYEGDQWAPVGGMYLCRLPVAVEDILIVKDDYQVK